MVMRAIGVIAVAGLALFSSSAKGQLVLNVSYSFTQTPPYDVVCKVTNDGAGGLNQLKAGFDMLGADLGYPVWDGRDTTWIFFGDTPPADGATWSAADSVAWFKGNHPETSACGSLSFLTAGAMTSSTQGGVFSPGIVLPPSGQPVADYVFQGAISHTSPPPTPTPPALPSGADIPGGNEIPTGGFFHHGKIYLFYAGSPHLDANSPAQLPEPSVSYLAVWNKPGTADGTTGAPYPTEYQILTKVDYNDQPDPASQPLPVSCNPLSGAPFPPPSSGWSAAAPLGGNFVKIAPVVEGGHVYLFGTGKYRNSQVHLARFPVSSLATLGTFPTLSAATGFQIWTAGARGAHWSRNNPPTAADISGAVPLTDDACPDVGEMSVQPFGQLGIWVMTYTPQGVKQVLLRSATSPTGPWSSPTVLVDLTQPAAPYCCSPQNMPCQSSAEEFVPCTATGIPLTGPYAPYLFPYLPGGVTYSQYTDLQHKLHNVIQGDAYYLLSVFHPYGAVLMTFTMTKDTTLNVKPPPPPPL